MLAPAAFCQQDAPPELKDYKPLTAGGKFRVAEQDSFGYGSFALAAAFAGVSQVGRFDPSFGQGVKGYGHYFATGYADLAIGNFMAEGVFPTLLHQDPRYFRRGHGSDWSRFRYSASQVFLTHGDSGQTQFNYSEVAGAASAAAISMAYYPDNRNAGDAIARFSLQIGVDMASNLFKEFAPDIRRKLSRKHRQTQAAPQ